MIEGIEQRKQPEEALIIIGELEGFDGDNNLPGKDNSVKNRLHNINDNKKHESTSFQGSDVVATADGYHHKHDCYEYSGNRL